MRWRNVTILTVLLLAMNMLAAAQTCIDSSYADRSPAERMKLEAADAELQRQELENLQRETVRAMQLHNGSFFNRVYSDDFLGTSPSGSVVDRAALVSAVQSSSVKYSSFVATDIRVRIFQNTAVVTCLWSVRGTLEGSNVARQYRVVNVYVRNDRGWRVVANQETQLPG
jgi:ketosteroid isomerase-like protein